MKAENDKLKQEIADLKKEQEVTKETERLEEDSHASNSVTTENLLAKLVNRKSDRGIIGLTSLLIRMNNTLLISAAFKGISLVRKVKA